MLTEVRGLAPGFVVSFTRPTNMWGAGKATGSWTRFPHLSGSGLGDATPDLLRFACELSAPNRRTVGEVIEATAAAIDADRPRLRRFATVLVDAGYLVLEPPESRFTGMPPRR